MPLIGNKVAEKDLRDWLQTQQWYGRSAVIQSMELVALARPGWIQVFQFRVRAKRRKTDVWDDLTGLLRDDGRQGDGGLPQVRLTPTVEEFQSAWDDWTAGMLIRRQSDRQGLSGGRLILFAAGLFGMALLFILRG